MKLLCKGIVAHVHTGKRSFASIPKIDLKPYFNGGAVGKQKVAAEFGEACEAIGFLTVVSFMQLWFSFIPLR
jgi:hypothetical protein